MIRLVICTFLFLGWAFYEMSGGADFDAEATRLARIEVPAEVEEEKLDTVLAEVAPTPAPQNKPAQSVLPENVTRVSLNLSAVEDVIRPEPTLRTEPARVIEPVEPQDITLSEEEPTVILPSLLGDQVVITPVDFSDEATGSQAGIDVRAVSGNRVNVRGGPGTNYSVVNRLVRGDEVEILQDPGDGWVKMRPIDGGPVGWMATFLLTEG